MTPSKVDLGASVLECTSDGVCVLDARGRVYSINSAGARLFEIDEPTQFIGLGWEEMWAPESRAFALEAVAQARDGSSQHFCLQAPTQKGSPRWWDVIVNPVLDGDQQLTHIIAIARDVTELKRTESALIASDKQFRALADNISQLAWMAHADGELFWYNKRWFDFTGMTLEEHRGWGWRAVHHPDHVERVVEKWRNCLATGAVWEDTFPLRGADGEYRWFLSRARPIRDEQGAVVLWCGTNTDVTEVRDYQRRLLQKAKLLDLSHEAILVRGLHGGVTLWNRGCAELYGYSAEEALASQCALELLQTQFPVPIEEVDRSLRETGFWSGEIRQHDKFGNVVWVESGQQLLNLDGEQVILESNRDITERRKADDIRMTLIAELNHRVKNTLTVVQAIASQTARRSTDIAQFLAEFSGRLQSLSGAHNLLADSEWRGVDLRDLVEGELITPDRVMSGAIEVVGQQARVSAQTAIQLALLLHELKVNAEKHGALSVPQGKVAVSWAVGESPESVNLIWREHGGPPVSSPGYAGFGRTLIERSRNLAYLCVDLRFEPEGVVCLMQIQAAPQTQSAAGFFDPRRARSF